MSMIFKYKYLLLFFIFFFGAILRFYRVDTNPPGLYIDEISIGNNAYDILHTGKDEYGVTFPIAFRSLDDYKPPLYIYLTAGSIALFGKNEFAVRFPSALAGSLTIPLLYFFLYHLVTLGKKEKSKESFAVKFSLLATFLLSFSQWHIQFSRGWFETTVGLFFFIAGLLMGILFWKNEEKSHYLFFSAFFFGLSIYTYQAYRIIIPITIILFSLLFFKTFPKKRIKIFLAFLFFLILIIPMIVFSLSASGLARFNEVSAFSEYPARTIVQKLLIYPVVYIKNYISFFSFNYLFRFGDQIGRHQIINFGLFASWKFPFLFIGFFYFLKEKRDAFKNLILFMLFVALIPAALGRPSPHTERVLPFIIPLVIIIDFGLYKFFEKIQKGKKIILSGVVFVIFYLFIYYLHFYYYHYPITNIMDWGGGYKQVVMETTKIQDKYDVVVVDKNLSYMQIYFTFYNDKIKPYFVDVTWNKPKEWVDKKVLYIRPNYGPTTSKDFLENVYLPNGSNDVFAQLFSL